MSLISKKIKQPSFKILHILLEQLLQELLAISFLSDQQKNTITEKSRQMEVLLALYPLTKGSDELNVKLNSFNDTDIEEQMSQLIADIKGICHQSKQAEVYAQCNEWYLTYQLWRILNHGLIDSLEATVNSIAETSNILRKPEDIIFMVAYVKEILDGVKETYKEDMFDSDPRRPWRVLLLNYGIIATRSHNADLIAASYDYFYLHLPEDAAQFITEAMSQMVAQNYPQSVRDIVTKYYHKFVLNQAYQKQTH